MIVFVLVSGAKFRSCGEKGSNVQSTSNASSSEKHTNQSDNNLTQSNNETLDLGDLDLSQLRLTKKDLETLSSITPNLPKHFQDQLLAQLPPNQARKLSRTLSMQATTRAPHVHKRSLSSGRDALDSEPPSIEVKATPLDDDKQTEPSPLLLFDRNSVLRRSMSRGREQTNRRSTSAIRSEYPSRLSYTGDLRSDYNATAKPSDSLVSRYGLTDSYTPSSTLRPEYYSKLPLPASSVSPQKSPSNETFESPMRRRPSLRGLSRFSRPDFYGSTSSINATEDNELLKVRRDRERETQSVLREIRERSRDRSRAIDPQPLAQPRVEPLPTKNAKDHQRRKSSIPNIRITVDKQNGRIYHTRNKSMERCCDVDDSAKMGESEIVNIRRASMANPQSSSVAKENDGRKATKQTAAEFTDEILSELVRRSKEINDNADPEEKKVDSMTLKKTKTKTKDGKKVKSKPKSDTTDQPTTKINNDAVNEVQSITLPLPKSSKIARRMSYTTKEDNDIDKSGAEKKAAFETEAKGNENKTADSKTYPTSKLTPPKEINLKAKKTTSNLSSGNTRNAITAVMEKFIEKSTERLSPGKSITATKSKSEVGEASPPKTKKKVKVVKKVVKSDQSPTKEPSPKSTNGTSNEASPVKETKSPEKKLKSGFLYSIGQKFEKMRENSKNKEKEKKIAKSIESPNDVASCSQKDVETVQTIIIPRRVIDSQGETIQKEEITIRQIELPSSISGNAKSEQRKSRIDAVIRNLRERSVPHTVRAESRESELATESGLLKRAVSVEDMTNGAVNSNKSNVNKVLGLFRRIEKEQQLQNQTQLAAECEAKERPKSGGFVSKMKKSGRPYYTGAKSDTIISLTDQLERQCLSERANQSVSNAAAPTTKIPFLKSSAKPDSFDFIANGTKEIPHSAEDKVPLDLKRMPNDVAKPQMPSTDANNKVMSEKERIRNNRKGLVLDLNTEHYNEHFKKISNDCSNNNNNSYHFNGKAQCNGSNDNHNNNYTNNNYYHHYGHSDRNSDALTPSCEVATNYSSDNRSIRDDCESTSTFLSPSEEPELCFDDWSACSGASIDY